MSSKNDKSDRQDRNAKRRNGTDRAAILLLSLGEKDAAEVLKFMGAKDVQRVGAAMTHLSNISREEASAVLSDFTATVQEQTSLGVGVDDYIRNMLVAALGEDKASGLIDRILMGRSSKGLESLKWMDPRAVSELIRLEHPQIIAIVLAYLDADQSASVLMQLPDMVRADVVMRIATLDGIQPNALVELDEIIEKQFSGKTVGKTSSFGGKKAAANILNLLDSSVESMVVDHIKEMDNDLGASIQDMMFVFDNLLDMDDRSIQEILRGVQSEQLLLALKGADETIKDKFFKNMSQRAAEMLRDDLAARGPVRLSEVEAAQKEILSTVRKLAEAGTIQMGGKGEQFV